MRFIKRIIQWSIGLICGLYLILQVTTHIPYTQEWMGRTIASTASSILGWNLSIGKIRFGLINRIIIDDVTLKDQQDSTLLHASRIAAKIDIIPLLDGKISIANAQLLGTKAHIYQSKPDEKPNFQFIIDTFSSNDSTNSPVNVHIGSILLRRVELKWDQQWMPHKDSANLDLSHLHIKDITLTAHLKTLTNDSINLSVKRLSFKEKSGLELKKLKLRTILGKEQGRIEDFCLELPHTTLSIPTIQATYPSMANEQDLSHWMKQVAMHGSMSLDVTPSDFKYILPQLCQATTPISINCNFIGAEDCLDITKMKLAYNNSLELTSKINLHNLSTHPKGRISIDKLLINKGLQYTLTQNFSKERKEISPILTRLDTVLISGNLQFTKEQQSAILSLENHTANIKIDVSITEQNSFKAKIHSSNIQLNKLLSDKGKYIIGNTSALIDVEGLFKDIGGKPKISLRATLPQITIQGNEYNNIKLNGDLNKDILSADIELDEENGSINSNFSWQKGDRHQITGNISIDKFHTSRLGVSALHNDAYITLDSSIDFLFSNIDDITGNLNINNFVVESSNMDSTIAALDSLSVSTQINNDIRSIDINSLPFNLTAMGDFNFSSLATTLQNLLHKQIPDLIPYKNIYGNSNNELTFQLDLQDTILFSKLGSKSLSIPHRLTLTGKLNGSDTLNINGYIPELRFKKHKLLNTHINVNGNPYNFQTTITTDRTNKTGIESLYLQANAHDNRVRLIAGLDNNNKPQTKGEIDISANFTRDKYGKRDMNIWIAPTDIIIADTLWRVHPANISWNERGGKIQGLKINTNNDKWESFADRGIAIEGLISSNEEDTLKVELQNFNVAYILNMVNFKSVEFNGDATGSVIATQLLSSPYANADLQIKKFSFNKAPLGTLYAKANWGNTPFILNVDAYAIDSTHQHKSIIKGDFSIGNKQKEDGLDLRVNTQNFNLAFLNFFTEGIFEDFKGRASGYCRIFGPFKSIDIEGDLRVNHADVIMPVLGTHYHLRNDSVHIVPGEINITATIMDDYALPIQNPQYNIEAFKTTRSEHTAVFNGKIKHENFKDMTFDFSAQANNLLGYDFKEFGENTFYATCFASGDVSIRGIPGRLNIDVNVTPEAGTSFTYNITTPSALTNAGFITINDIQHIDSIRNINKQKQQRRNIVSHLAESSQEISTSSDLFLNFNLQLTPEAKMRLLMDPKSGDMIEAVGSGRIMAKYYNKGRFNIYGTYRVQEGSYRLSLQDIIQRDFKFHPGGTVTFGGDPMKADINLKAIYRVNSVSLDDLATSSLGFAKTRVDCVLNLSGRTEQPIVNFDFELPEATEDERQMVRSIVSTEEERNMQTIYLLGLGRFYNFESNESTQSSAAMNSLVSSTLSTQLNQLISNAVGSNNWSIGANLKTGDDGWRNMDVEGMLSGRLLNNRLHLTGNFGYREKYYTQRSIISDVSVEYYLTKNGNISLKAYNQANDRYFVQSSLNTQGIGIQFKKDFNKISDLYFWMLPRKTENKK